VATIVFCSDPTRPARPDPDYAAETDAARAAGFSIEAVDHDSLVKGDAAATAGRIPRRAAREIAIYRGWMMSPRAYAALFDALIERNLALVSDPGAYRHAHWLPESYSVIRGRTPESVWLPGKPPAMDEIHSALRVFADRPVLLKDYVKSRKHEWLDACFIAHASDRAAVERSVRRFVELQGDDFAEGLVFREFVQLQSIGDHPQSGMPLSREHRFFVAKGKPLLASAYWNVAASGAPPPFDEFESLAERVQSPFFTLDVAKRENGDWLVIELGDGGVAGLPDGADASAFYRALFAAFA